MSQVEIILGEDVYGLGTAGDLVSVKPGYARNFLLPTGKAQVATKERVKELEHQKRVIADRTAKEMTDLESLKNKLEATALTFSAQAGDEGKLFGSITTQHIAEQLAEKGLKIDRRKIALHESIKSIGEHTIGVRLRNSLIAELKVTVEAAE
jgi:large subunit ribosomal protein L9